LNYSNLTNYNAALGEIGLSSNESAFNMNVTVAYLNGTIMNLSGPALPGTTDIGQIKHIVLIINSSTGYNETAILSVRVW
jgi:hypothetical protein